MQIILNEIKRHMPRGAEARRLFHGRGRSFPRYQDLLIDSYGDLLWLTLFAEREAGWCQDLSRKLVELLPQVDRVVLQRRDLPRHPLEVLLGELPQNPLAHEAGLDYILRPETGQNIGFFIDMAAGRALVRERAAGRRVLNLFAYSCSFSVAAIAGGAAKVINVDMNRGALELGRRNHLQNKQDLRQVSFLNHEIFRSISRLRKLGPFDLVICDPPFAQGRSFTAEQHWPKLIKSLGDLLAPGGEVIACLNAPQLGPDYLRRLFGELQPGLGEISCLAAGEDFPEADPERGLSLHHYVPSFDKTLK